MPVPQSTGTEVVYERFGAEATRPCTIFLIRSEDLIWLGTRLILDSFPDVTIVGEALRVTDVPTKLAAITPPPDLIVTAPQVSELPIQELLPYLRRACPTACILVLTEEVGPDDLAALAATGIDRYAGYLLWRDLSAATLRQCLGVASGGDVLVVSRAVAETFLTTQRDQPPDPPPIDLTAQEQAVLACLAAGRTSPESAATLGISPRTLKRVVARLHEKLGGSTLFTLGVRAATLGLLPDQGNVPPPPESAREG